MQPFEELGAPSRKRLGVSLGATEKTTLTILAIAAVIAGLSFFASALTQFALAALLWLGVSGFANWLQSRARMPRWAALALGGLVVVGTAGIIGVMLARTIADLASELEAYRTRLNVLITQSHMLVGLPPPAPTLQQLLERIDASSWLAQTAGGLQGIMADALFILIYLGFIFGASAGMSQKFDRIFPMPKQRERARRVISRIKASMEMYLWTQTVISLVISALTFATLEVLGLENALFWSLLIFFLNYIPTIGSILATVLPTLVAIVQFEAPWQIAAVALGTGFWQFSIGNFVQPRLMGESLNLSALVVLLSLSIWGSVWGIAGAFLAAPLTVAIMIVLAQFPSTRWMAILLSGDGRPERSGAGERKKKRLLKASETM